MLVTSAKVLSDVHRGGCAVPFPMLTSENGIFEGVLKAGISLDPRSFFKWKEDAEAKKKMFRLLRLPTVPKTIRQVKTKTKQTNKKNSQLFLERVGPRLDGRCSAGPQGRGWSSQKD